MKHLAAFAAGALITAASTPSAAPVNLLLREVNLLWRYVESGSDNPDIPALDKALDLRDQRLKKK